MNFNIAKAFKVLFRPSSRVREAYEMTSVAFGVVEVEELRNDDKHADENRHRTRNPKQQHLRLVLQISGQIIALKSLVVFILEELSSSQ